MIIEVMNYPPAAAAVYTCMHAQGCLWWVYRLRVFQWHNFVYRTQKNDGTDNTIDRSLKYGFPARTKENAYLDN